MFFEVLVVAVSDPFFTLALARRQFLRTHEDMRVPDSGPLICMNEGNYREYNGAVQHYLKQVKQRGVSDGKVRDEPFRCLSCSSCVFL